MCDIYDCTACIYTFFLLGKLWGSFYGKNVLNGYANFRVQCNASCVDRNYAGVFWGHENDN